MDRVDLIGIRAVHQGADWLDVWIKYPGDISAGTLRGQIRAKTVAAELLAEFGFRPMVLGLDGDTTVTVIQPTLTAIKTLAIPAGTHRYDIFCTLPDRRIKIVEGELICYSSVTAI